MAGTGEDAAARLRADGVRLFRSVGLMCQLQVFSYLSPEEVLGESVEEGEEQREAAPLALTCKHFGRLVAHPALWRVFFLREFLFLPPDTVDVTMKDFLRRRTARAGWQEGKSSQYSLETMRGHEGYISHTEHSLTTVLTASLDGTVRGWNPEEGGRDSHMFELQASENGGAVVDMHAWTEQRRTRRAAQRLLGGDGEGETGGGEAKMELDGPGVAGEMVTEGVGELQEDQAQTLFRLGLDASVRTRHTALAVVTERRARVWTAGGGEDENTLWVQCPDPTFGRDLSPAATFTQIRLFKGRPTGAAAAVANTTAPGPLDGLFALIADTTGTVFLLDTAAGTILSAHPVASGSIARLRVVDCQRRLYGGQPEVILTFGASTATVVHIWSVRMHPTTAAVEVVWTPISWLSIDQAATGLASRTATPAMAMVAPTPAVPATRPMGGAGAIATGLAPIVDFFVHEDVSIVVVDGGGQISCFPLDRVCPFPRDRVAPAAAATTGEAAGVSEFVVPQKILAPATRASPIQVTCAHLAHGKVGIGTSLGAVELFDVNTHNHIFYAAEHTGRVNDLCFDDNRLLTASTDKSIKIFHLGDYGDVEEDGDGDGAAAAAAGPVGGGNGAAAPPAPPTRQLRRPFRRPGHGPYAARVPYHWTPRPPRTHAAAFTLLGGSLQRRGGQANAEHPVRPGVSFVSFDQSRVFAIMGSMLRVYSFGA